MVGKVEILLELVHDDSSLEVSFGSLFYRFGMIVSWKK
jgi:hypothetical protein